MPRSAGMDDYLSKPAQPDQITRVIRNLFLNDTPAPADNTCVVAAGDDDSSIDEICQTPVSEPDMTLDIQAALRVFADDMDILKEAGSLFITRDYPKQRVSIQTGIQEQDSEAIMIAAHSIKGASRSLGGLSLGEAAFRLEEKGRAGDISEASELLELIEKEFRQFSNEFNKL